jgi:hypothetical protein
MMRYLILFLLLLNGVIGVAQDISTSTIKWNSPGFTDLNSNTDVTSNCQFITEGDRKIKWIQDNGKFVVDWKVNKSSGTWSDVNQTGAISLSFTDDKVNGELTIKKDGTEWIINLTISGGPSNFNLRYGISSIEKLK